MKPLGLGKDLRRQGPPLGAVVGGLDKVVFLPSGSNLNLFDSMQGLLGPGVKNGTAGEKIAGGSH